MKYTLTMHQDAWFRSNQEFASGRVIGYWVAGMPVGKGARIADFGAPIRDDWRIRRIDADNTQTEWTGKFESPEAALAELQREFAGDA